MSAILDATLCALDRRLGYGTSNHRVVRVDLQGDGGLVLTVQESGSQRWFVAQADVLMEFHPHYDYY